MKTRRRGRRTTRRRRRKYKLGKNVVVDLKNQRTVVGPKRKEEEGNP
jgi:hypothetical protein